ncbi:hypothetical protein DPMN_048113, partial [Dreissena polymorpha]
MSKVFIYSVFNHTKPIVPYTPAMTYTTRVVYLESRGFELSKSIFSNIFKQR